MNNKKTIIILILILFIGIIGLTVAYFSNSTTIDNLFSTKEYGSTITETFTSPSNWLPGDETNKKVVATNTGEVDQAVRISLTEKWISSNNKELNGWIHEDGTKSNHETELELNTDERVAFINFDNNDDWTYNNGYYYYNYRLQPNESTSSLIKSVSFNSKTKLDDTCTTTISEGKKIITCNSSGDNYDGATYTLTFNIETVQYNKYMNAWNTDVAILNEQSLFCDAFEVGEVVTYNNADYYVLKDSSTSDDYVTLLKKDPLTASEVNQYSTNYLSQDGEYPYYESDTCNENDESGCSTNYDTSDVKKIVDRWSSSFSDDLIEIDGYKARLINYDDLFNDLHYQFENISPSASGYKNSESTPDFVQLDDIIYWSTFNVEESSKQLYGISNSFTIANEIYNKLYIRPAINLKKSAINGACYINKYSKYLTCNKGEEVFYNNEKYYVINDSHSNIKYVTLLKANPLTAEEVNTYDNDYESQNGEYPFCFDSNGCRGNEYGGAQGYKFDYFNSDIKKIVDNWAKSYDDDLVSINNIKTRFIDMNDLEDYLGYFNNNASINTPSWVYNTDKYWTSINYFNYSPSNSKEGIYGVTNTLTEESVNNELYIRPVINLKKVAIERGCNIIDTNYVVGNNIFYKNNNYCVISNSTVDDDYVSLIKQEPLTYEELITYNNGYEIERDSIDNNSGIISYYKSDNCYDYNDYTGCNTDYNDSFVKNIINNWSNSISNDLIEVNGYKARLLKYDELTDLGHIYYPGTPGRYEKSSIDCLYSDADYWTMTPGIYSSHIHIVANRAVWGEEESNVVFTKHAVRPVINLKKCAIDNTCE